MWWKKKNTNNFARKRYRFTGSSRMINPRRTERGGLVSKVFQIINLIAVVVLIYFVYFFFFSGYYQVKNIQVNGVQYVGSDEVLGLVQSVVHDNSIGTLKTQNIFLVSDKKILEVLRGRYVFASVAVHKKLPDSIIVDIVEKNVLYRLTSDDSQYLVDDQGIVVRKNRSFASRPPILSVLIEPNREVLDQPKKLEETLVSYDPADQFTVLYLEKDAGIDLGQRIMSQQVLELLATLSKNVTTTLYTIRLLVLPEINPQHLILVTTDGWKVFYAVNGQYSTQYQTLANVVAQEIKPERLKKVDYVDLRLNENIYYKMK